MNSSVLGRHAPRAVVHPTKNAAPLVPALGIGLGHCLRSESIFPRPCTTNAATSRGNGRGGSQDDMDYHETKLGPNVIASIKDLRAGVSTDNAVLSDGLTLSLVQ